MDYLAVNKETWNKRTHVHLDSKFYDVAGFLKGKNVLNDIEVNDLGDVTGKSLLHLQCHFGLDTLSWARLGAKVTGVDLSSAAIDKAQSLAVQTGLDANFVCSDLYSFGANSQQQFDIVFTSYGVLCWLPDINKWAQTVANSLTKGGTFYIAEFHPFYDVHAGYSYFHKLEPDVEEEAAYTENANEQDTSTIVTWAHPLADVINALIKVGIQITEFNEYPYSPYNCFADMKEKQPGKFYIEHNGENIPLIYTIKGRKI